MHNPDTDEIERAILAADLRDILSRYSARINGDIERIKLSPLTIYCMKTGAPIGTLNRDALETTLKIHGADRFEEIMINANLNAYHPAWQFTDNASLDRLMTSDPQGYAVFAFNMLCNVLNTPKHMREENQITAHWALARAWQYLSLLSPMQLDLLNDNLCACLTFAPDTVRFMRLRREIARAIPYADEMAKLALDGTLIPILDNAVEQVMETMHRWDIAEHTKRLIVHKMYENLPKTPADAARGPSNIRLQKRAKRHVERQNAIKIETEFSIGLMQFMQEDRLPKANWIARKINAIKSAPLGITALDLSEVSDLGSFDFNEMPDGREDDEEDDNRVIVRTISREEYAAEKGEQITPKPAYAINTPRTASASIPETNAPKLTIAERIARNDAARAARAQTPVIAPAKTGNAIWAKLQARKNSK